MAKRVQTQNRVNPHGRKIPSKHRHESLDATDDRGPTSQERICAESKCNVQSDLSIVIENSVHQESMSRPGSAFSVYRPLPEIGQKLSKPFSPDVLDNVIQNVGSLQIQEFYSPHVKKKKRMKEPEALEYNNFVENYNIIPHSPDAKVNKLSSSSNDAKINKPESHPRKITRRELRSIQLRQRRSSQNLVPPEPQKGTERLLIAVRLPAGERIQRYFLPSNTITNVVAFAENQVKESFAGCDVFVNNVPKKKLFDLQSSLTDCNIQDRTLLLLEERDVEESEEKPII